MMYISIFEKIKILFRKLTMKLNIKSGNNTCNNTGDNNIQQIAGRDINNNSTTLPNKNIDELKKNMSELYPIFRKKISAIKLRKYDQEFDNDDKTIINFCDRLSDYLFFYIKNSKSLSKQINLIRDFLRKKYAQGTIAFATIDALMLLDKNWRDKDPIKFTLLKKIKKILKEN